MLLRICTMVLATTVPGFAQTQIQVDAGRGPVTIFVPSSYNSANPSPLLFLLHGDDATGAEQEAYMLFGPEAEARGVLFAHPTGLVGSFGVTSWNFEPADGTPLDDSTYLRRLIDTVKGQFNVDPLQVSLVGH